MSVSTGMLVGRFADNERTLRKNTKFGVACRQIRMEWTSSCCCIWTGNAYANYKLERLRNNFIVIFGLYQIKPVEIMLYWNFDINAVTNENETPILLATRNGHKNLTSLLLDNGADPFIASKFITTLLFDSLNTFNIARSKSSPLSEATKKNRPEIVELLQDAINR